MVTQTQGEHSVGVEERPRYRFTVDKYERMVEVGILDEYDKVELIDGEIIEMSAMNSPHARALEYLGEELVILLARRFAVRVQTPLAIPSHDEPEPDVLVIRRREDRYVSGVPRASDVLLVIEVSDTTYAYDRRRKLPMYARGGVPEVWIADLVGTGANGFEGIERHSDPHPASGQYRSMVRLGRGERITSLTVPEISLPVDEVLGPPSAG